MVLLDLKPKGLCRARFLGEPLDGGPSRGLYRKCVHAVLSVAPTLGVQFWDIMSQNIFCAVSVGEQRIYTKGKKKVGFEGNSLYLTGVF